MDAKDPSPEADPAATPDAAPEAVARRRIDAQLRQAGWQVQDRAAVRLAGHDGVGHSGSAVFNVAVRELPAAGGEADDGLFVGPQLAGVIEAKKLGSTLGGVEMQTLAYASEPLAGLTMPIQPLPFRYECNGVETFFSNGLDPEPTARRVFNMHWPETLAQWLNAELQRRAGNSEAPPMATLKGRIRQAEPLNRAGMWPAQIRAVENLEASVREGRRRALIQMATGGGKTFKATSAAYRLIRQAGARRCCFWWTAATWAARRSRSSRPTPPRMKAARATNSPTW